MKQRFSSLDVRVIAHELSTALVSLRISNIYDLSSRIFLFKCAKPGQKAQLLVDSGFRCHLTYFSRTAEPAPSAFVTRLRKYLKSRRITSVTQLGTDRVIDITFSDGAYHLFLEFFAAGNIVLTDKEHNVLALLRQVSEGDEDVDVKLGSKYVLEAKQNYHGIPPLTEERVKEVLQKAVERAKDAQAVGGKKAKRQKGGDNLVKALASGFSEYPFHLLEHIFTQSDFKADAKAEDVLQSEQAIKSVLELLNKADTIFQKLSSGTNSAGYIIAKDRNAPKDDSADQDPPARESLLYDDYHPFRPSQFENQKGIRIIEFDNYNKTVDEFYSSIETQRLEGRLTEREEAAKKKLDAAKDEHRKRLGALQQAQELHVRKAEAIEANPHRVEEAIAAVNGLIGQGMDWVDIAKLIENEQKRDNPVAQMIKLPLKLHENTVTLLLSEPGIEEESDSDDADRTDTEEESDEESAIVAKKKASETADRRLAIDVDLASSPWANARQYYDQKKVAVVKEQKTMKAADKALKSMEKKTEADLKKGLKQEKTALRPARRQFWFEKFLYFISSDGYLVIGGKDSTQNEILYRRYLKRGDIYVSADLTGASSVVVKNNPNTPDAPIPPSTLSQAGALAVCTSTAWDSKAVMAAYWVNADQVSKTALTGGYIKTGGFNIMGTKNFLPPTQLVLGFGVMWLISEASRANHGKHRVQEPGNHVENEVEEADAELQDLSIEDHETADESEAQEDGEVVPDVEDAADQADSIIETGDEELNVNEADEDDDNASTSGRARINPLQTTGRQHSENESEDDESGPDDGNEETEDEEPKSEITQPTSTKPNQQNQPKQKSRPKRGANTKAKRAAKEKYALQSDEERELAMSLLGSTKGQSKREAEEKAKQAREEKAKQDKERRQKQHERAVLAEQKRTERLEKGEFGDADNAHADDDIKNAEQLEQEKQDHLNIDLLVPHAQPGDDLLAAIPVVAPWSALSRTKYKVKLQPGSVKKGKLVKEILGVWTSLGAKGPKVVDETNLDREKVWAREIELVKNWKAEEIVGVVPVKGCRVVQGGGGFGASGGAAHGGRGKSNVRGGKGGKRK